MADLSNVSLVYWELWFTLKVLEKTEITDIELLALLGDKGIARIKELQLAKKREQYEKLKPVWFEYAYAPERAKKYREALKDRDDVEQMAHLQKILAYNPDWTVNIGGDVNKTFCPDLTWNWTRRNVEDAKELATIKSCHLMTTRNDWDSDEIKKWTDLYKLIHTFSEKYIAQWALIAMLGCDIARCWSATPYKDGTLGPIRIREWGKDYLGNFWVDSAKNYLVCGFKNSM